MTKREFYEAIITANFNAEVTDFAKESLAKLLKSRLIPDAESDGTGTTFVGRMISGWKKQ